MNSVLTYAADAPLMRRKTATKSIWASAFAALAAVTLAVAASSAFAADLPVKAPPAPPPPPLIPLYNWSGFYIGGNLGGAWERTSLNDEFFDVNFTNTRSGFIGGGQVGYNWQLSPSFVLGVEWMFDATSIKTDATVMDVFGDTITESAKVDWIQTLAARFGWAANNWLFYGKAGGGWVRDSITLTAATGVGALSASASDTRGGWLVGAGIEYGITPNWSARIEWDHIGLGDVNHPGFVGIDGIVFDNITVSRRFDLLTFGVNYRFGGF